jgi:hypothetical protein
MLRFAAVHRPLELWPTPSAVVETNPVIDLGLKMAFRTTDEAKPFEGGGKQIAEHPHRKDHKPCTADAFAASHSAHGNVNAARRAS